MFKFLKEKLKNAVKVFSKKVEEESEIEPVSEIAEEKTKEVVKSKPVSEKKSLKKEESGISGEVIENKPKYVEEKLETTAEAKQEKKGFFKKISERITTLKLSEEKYEDLFWDLEMGLLENNVAVEVINKIKEDLKQKLVNKQIKRKKLDTTIKESLKESIMDLFNVEKINLLQDIKEKNSQGEPYIILFIGINGVGKTTNLAKVANFLEKKKISTVIAAADTFRVAAIEQLEYHGNKLGIKVIKHEYGSDAAAVCYDAIAHAKAKKKDVVLIDTAGRSNANINLMEELRKINKITKPDLRIFVGDALTGNDAVEQAKEFDKYVGIDAILLAKTDADEKGGASISISYVTKKPILFIGTGQGYEDLKEFDPELIIKNLGL